MTQSSTGDGEVRATLTFAIPQDTKPYFNSSAITGGLPEIFFKTEDCPVDIRSMRPVADDLSLDRQGFVLLNNTTTVDDLYDDTAIDEIYNKEVTALLKDYTGADRVVIFDHTRRSDNDDGAANPDGLRGPADRVHVDYTPLSGPVRARDTMGADDYDRVIKNGGRLVQINVWRPISGPVKRTPLALADAQSMKAEEMLATDQIFPDRVGEIYQIAHSEDQIWYWAPEMRRDEILLIKGWDSDEDETTRYSAHGAFRLPDQNPDDPPRESIETRTYVIFDRS
jgi:hypothetical protein